MKKLILSLMLIMLNCMSAWSADFDKFTRTTVEGVTMTFMVTDESKLECQVAGKTKDSTNVCISKDYEGKITIPSTAGKYTVTGIGGYAFYGCRKVTEIEIPESVTAMASGHIFENCTNLERVNIPENLTSLYGESMFKNCSSLKEFQLPEGFTVTNPIFMSFGTSMFEKCISLTAVVVPDGITGLGDLCFYGCSNLFSLTLPNSITDIGKNAFGICI